MKWLLLLLFALPLSAQQPVVKEILTLKRVDKLDPSLPWMSEFHAPPIYEAWWREIAQCEGLPFDVERFRRVQYFQANADEFIPVGVDFPVFAVTFVDPEQSFIGLKWIYNKSLIQHEALHILLAWSGDKTWFRHDPQRYEICGLHSFGPPS